LTRICLALLILALSSTTLADENLIDIANQKVKIILRPNALKSISSSKSKKAVEKEFQKACANFGNALLYGRGPWGLGSFESYQCAIEKRFQFEKDSLIDWVIVIEPSPKNVRFKLGRLRETEDGRIDFREYNTIAVPASKKFFEALQHPELADFFSQAMLNAMPMSFMIPNYAVPNFPSVDFERKIYKGRAWRSDSTFLQPAPAEKFKVFRVYFDMEKNEYSASDAGTVRFGGFESELIDKGDHPDSTKVKAKRSRDAKQEKGAKDKGEGKKESSVKGAKERVPSEGEAKPKKKPVNLIPVWHLDDESIDKLKQSRNLWGKAINRSKKSQQRLDSIFVRVYRYLTEGDPSLVRGLLVNELDDDEEDIATKIRRLDVELPGGFAGFRYGRSIVLNDPLLSQTSFIGVLLSVKHGPLDGFNFYFDMSPMVTAMDAVNQSNHVKWTRAQIGYGFDFKLVDFRFDLTPKIGIWNWDSRLSVQVGDALVPFEMKLDNGLSAGVELGLEFRIPLISARAWLGQDGAFGLTNRLTGSTIQSFRGGIEAFYTVGSIFATSTREYGLAIMGFTFFDRTTLGNPAPVTIESETEEELITAQLDSVGYDSAFFGLGLSLSW
jgi:hypothetical protein